MKLLCQGDRCTQALPLEEYPKNIVKGRFYSDGAVEAQLLIPLPIIIPIYDACACICFGLDAEHPILLDPDAVSLLSIGQDADDEMEVGFEASVEVDIVDQPSVDLSVDTAVYEADLWDMAEVVLDLPLEASAVLGIGDAPDVTLDIELEAEADLEVGDDASVDLNVEVCESDEC